MPDWTTTSRTSLACRHARKTFDRNTALRILHQIRACQFDARHSNGTAEHHHLQKLQCGIRQPCTRWTQAEGERPFPYPEVRRAAATTTVIASRSRTAIPKRHVVTLMFCFSFIASSFLAEPPKTRHPPDALNSRVAAAFATTRACGLEPLPSPFRLSPLLYRTFACLTSLAFSCGDQCGAALAAAERSPTTRVPQPGA